ncbi:MAG TPA: ABC transporter permease subunit [Xanthobacteraceae bacterium]|nr:ABC transporter permease subunit [Xanthobacteraceae bacterium]
MTDNHYLAVGGNTLRAFLPNRWDLVAAPLMLAALALAFIGVRQMQAPIEVVQEATISLDPTNLPEYALRTVLRMLAGLVASLVFTFTYATLAAKSRRAGLVLIPILDILQSVPILGYISFTVVFFMSLFPGKVLGAELACVFAIFTSQAWNMAFSFYQSLVTVPHDLDEASRSFHFSSWQRFWRLDVPFAMPGLIWNMMMSMSGAWFFVVASEAITVGDKTITLPGIGSYVAMAIDQKDLGAVGWAIIAMTIVILLYDQLMFRPLVAWSDKFRFEQTAAQVVPESWVLDLVQKTRFVRTLGTPFGQLFRYSLRFRVPIKPMRIEGPLSSRIIDVIWYAIIAAAAVYCVSQVVDFISSELSWGDVWHVFLLSVATMVRVVLLIALASLIWVPVGVWIGLRPRWAEKVQPLAQFLAAFPANLFFPVAVVVIVSLDLNVDLWVSPLMILGTQWYILFNVIAGASAFPTDLKEAANIFHIRGWQWWRKVILPGVFPYYVTGAITASGGAWNASIVSEYVKWGDTKLIAHGVGAYIQTNTEAGDYPRIVLGIVMLSLFVTVFNRALWRPLYQLSERKLRLD